MRLHEAKKLENEVGQKLSIQEIITSSLCMVAQTHIWHWQTTKYSAHMALGNFYTFLQGQVDLLAEIFIGSGNTYTFNHNKEPSNFISINDVKAKLENFKTELVTTEAELMKDENAPLHSAGDTILDIIKETDKLLYLLTLE